MKKSAVILLTTILATTAISASDEIIRVPKAIGVNIYHSSPVSGFNSNTNFNIGIEKENKLIEGGLILQHGENRISGGNVVYRRYLFAPESHPERATADNSTVRFFMQYNFQFRYSNGPGSMHLISPGSDPVYLNGGRIATYDHKLGIGVQVRLIDNFCINASAGVNLSLGSIDDEFATQPNYAEAGIRTDLSPSLNIGIGYFIVR
ncbi:MAG: hypothetical protein EA408_06105 [Marinilabiliales bacterium]|nr:MAG: hypothetical protein EA408_06105 [Marinilabiliales bacterium]